MPVLRVLGLLDTKQLILMKLLALKKKGKYGWFSIQKMKQLPEI